MDSGEAGAVPQISKLLFCDLDGNFQVLALIYADVVYIYVLGRTLWWNFTHFFLLDMCSNSLSKLSIDLIHSENIITYFVTFVHRWYLYISLGITWTME